MRDYKLYVYCRRNGMSQDAGLHVTLPFADDKAALVGMEKDARSDTILCGHYDDISCTVKEAGSDPSQERVVGKFHITRRVDTSARPRSFHGYGR